MSERNSDPEKKYEPALDAALERAGDRLEEIHREIESAAGLLEELTATPSPERPERIRTEVRFHALKLCDLLLKRSRESWFRDPARTVELARMAVEIADWLDAGYYGESLVEDEKAIAWAYLGNAYRITSDLRSAEEAEMKKLINDPRSVVREMLEGLTDLTPGQALLDGEDVVLRAGLPPYEARREVAVLSGGGSGHEPAHAGYVGRCMLSAAVAGDVFTSPAPAAVLAAIRATTIVFDGHIEHAVAAYRGDAHRSASQRAADAVFHGVLHDR